jgi:S-adenosylmethionine:tRNA ribosyltransferase-isomerase
MNAKFVLPPELHAKEPPEIRGIGRDGVRLLVLDRQSGETRHDIFKNLGSHLRRGDLLVFNASRTLPAVLAATDRNYGTPVEVRLAERLPDGSWLALLLCRGGELFACGLRSGMTLDFSDELSAEVCERNTNINRLWRLKFSEDGQRFFELIYALGKPIRYEYVSSAWSLDQYQTIYATEPGSAEMPSAGRAFSWKVMFSLRKMGVKVANIVLHTGLSSYMDDQLDAQHPASEEEYFIGETAAEAINRTRMSGGRVVAVGTTVVRALESHALTNGFVTSGHSFTSLHIDREFTPRVVDGLITGFHEPEASHLDLLSAFVPPNKLFAAYEEALNQRYLWHEFGDVNLII